MHPELLEALQDKERRVQQQLERCAEERGRKMEEQRRKEQKRRAAAEEKRRQQQEAEKVRGRRYANGGRAQRKHTASDITNMVVKHNHNFCKPRFQTENGQRTT